MCSCFRKKYINKELSVCFLDNSYTLIDRQLEKLYKKKILVIMNDNHRYREYLREIPVFSLLVERISEYMVSDLLNVYMKNNNVGLLRICLLWYVIVIMDGIKSDISFITSTDKSCSLRVTLNGEIYYVNLDIE